MKKIIFIISFFTFSGFYAGLAFIYSLNLVEYSRFYTIPLRVILSIFMIVIIMQNRKNLVLNKNGKYLTMFIIFWIIYIVKVLYTESISTLNDLGKLWYEYILYSILYVVIPFLTFYLIDYEKFKKQILEGFIFSGFILGVVSLYLYGKYLLLGIGRLNNVRYITGEEVLSPLALSYSGVLTIVLCMYKFLIVKEEKNIKNTTYLLITIILSFIMFLLGSSRGSVIAFVLSVPFFITQSAFKQKIKIISLSILSIPIIIWAMEASGSSLFNRIGNTSDDDGGGRGSLWSNALDHFYDYPILGGRIEIGGIYPHNFIIEILMATGFIGFILLVPVIIRGFTIGNKMSKEDPSNLFLLLTLIVGFSQHLFSGGIYTAISLFTPLGIILGTKIKKK